MKRRIIAWGLVALPLIVLGGAALVVGGSYLEHRDLVRQEKAAYPPPGSIVRVDADDGEEVRLHVYAAGRGDPTLVFLAGLGTSAPVFDFRPLYDRLSEDYRIAVVERVGYGWSEIARSPRDIDTVLGQTRAALAGAGEAPPYVLLPHSMAGLEAVRWAQEHPNEVAAIIGLDPLVPGYIEEAGETAELSPLITALARTGLMRSGPDVFESNFPAMVEDRLSEEEAAAARALFMRRTNTPPMWAEVRRLDRNAALVRAEGVPDVPVHALVSARQSRAWIDAVAAHAEAAGGQLRRIEAGHYLHVERPDSVAEAIRAIIEARGED